MDSRPLIVGLPSLNEVDTITGVVRAVDRGLVATGRLGAIICNADSGSSDGTQEAFLTAATINPKLALAVPAGIPGKGSNVRAILEFAASRGADCLLFDTDLLTITPEWIRTYVEALRRGYDYVVPVYRRGKHAATVTNTLIFPLVSGILGVDIRQPIGGDVALSAAFALRVVTRLRYDADLLDVTGYGLDAYLTCVAIEERQRICAGQLGRKVHRVKSPALHLQPVFVEEAMPVIDLIIRTPAVVDTFARTVPTVGDVGLSEVSHPGVNGNEVHEIASALAPEAGGRIAEFASPEGLQVLRKVQTGSAPLRISNADWITLVVDVISGLDQKKTKNAALFSRGGLGREMITLLFPFYLARVVDLVLSTQHAGDDEVEGLIREYAAEFRARRPEFLSRLSGSHGKPVDSSGSLLATQLT